MEPSTNPIVAGYALLLLLGLPALAALDARRGVDLEHAARFRRALYVSVAISLLLVAGVTFGVAIWQGVPAARLGWQVRDARAGFAWGVGLTGGGLVAAWLVTAGARAVGLREGPLARALMPRDAGEKRAFLLLSGVSALCEEYVFRGFLLYTVAGWTSSPWFAAAVVTISFGLAHGYQRLAGILRASALGFVLAVPVVVTESLFPAILAHFWINAAVGMGGWRWLLPELEVSSDAPGGCGATAAEEEKEQRMDRERKR